MNYYNDNDLYIAKWLKALIDAKIIVDFLSFLLQVDCDKWPVPLDRPAA